VSSDNVYSGEGINYPRGGASLRALPRYYRMFALDVRAIFWISLTLNTVRACHTKSFGLQRDMEWPEY